MELHQDPCAYFPPSHKNVTLNSIAIEQNVGFFMRQICKRIPSVHAITLANYQLKTPLVNLKASKFQMLQHDETSKSCTECLDGAFSTTGRCEICPDGKWHNDDHTACISCELGYKCIVSGNKKVLELCPRNHFSRACICKVRNSIYGSGFRFPEKFRFFQESKFRFR